MKAGIVCCSNGQRPERKEEINELIRQLAFLGVSSVKGKHLYAREGAFGGSAEERAKELMTFYLDESIGAIFDISGGDIANEILGFLDYEAIARSEKRFWGYSDLTTVINAIYTKTGKESVLYQVKNLVWEDAGVQKERFRAFITGKDDDLFRIRYGFLQGRQMEGILVGGNVRCLLKLAGTPYWPDMRGKLLLLEALGGEEPQVTAYFNQLRQMGVFDQAAGILLGTFTKLEQSGGRTAFDLLFPLIPRGLPVAATPDIGHGSDARAAVIGAFSRFGG